MKKMNIAMIEPSQGESQVFARFSSDWPLLGPIILATILEQSGHNVVVLNENLVGRLSESDLGCFDAIGISCVTSTAPRAYELAELFKKVNPQGYVALGGFHPHFMKQEAIDNPNVDSVLVGDGELKVREMFESRLEGIVRGPRVDLNRDVPELDLSLIRGGHKLKRIPIQTARGCPHTCDYCSVWTKDGREIRYRDNESIVQEIVHAERQGRSLVFDYSDNLFDDPARLEDLCHRLIAAGVESKLMGQGAPQDLTDPRLMALAAKAGFYKIFIGFESEDDQTLADLGKPRTAESHRECIDVLRSVGIKRHGMYMIRGDHIEIPEGLSTLQVSIETPIPGSRLFYQTQREGKFLFPLTVENWRLFDGMHALYHMPGGVAPIDVQNTAIDAYRQFYSFKELAKRFSVGDARPIRGLVEVLGAKTIIRRFLWENREFMKRLSQIEPRT